MMNDDSPIYESEAEDNEPDPDEIPIKDRHVYTQPYDLVVESLIDQIKGGTIFLRPISERPSFQRRYVWTNTLASRLIESILLNVPIPPCYLSQNDDFELDVIDGQQRLFSIYRNKIAHGDPAASKTPAEVAIMMAMIRLFCGSTDAVFASWWKTKFCPIR